MTAPGGITKNWVLVTYDLKGAMPGEEQLWGNHQGQGTEAGESGVQAPRGEWAKTQSKPAEHPATPQVFIAYRQLCTFTHTQMQSPSHVQHV